MFLNNRDEPIYRKFIWKLSLKPMMIQSVCRTNMVRKMSALSLAVASWIWDNVKTSICFRPKKPVSVFVALEMTFENKYGVENKQQLWSSFLLMLYWAYKYHWNEYGAVYSSHMSISRIIWSIFLTSLGNENMISFVKIDFIVSK